MSSQNPNNDKVIIFNGPPRSGKDTYKQMLMDLFPGDIAELRFAYPLKNGAHALLSLYEPTEAYNECKDVRHEDFFGEIPREFYIKISEELMKPTFGEDVFGRLWLREYCKRYGSSNAARPIAVISDCGFREELEPLKSYFGPDNLIIIRLFREGCNYKKDSRNYLYDTGCREFNLRNLENNQRLVFENVLSVLEETGVLSSI